MQEPYGKRLESLDLMIQFGVSIESNHSSAPSGSVDVLRMGRLGMIAYEFGEWLVEPELGRMHRDHEQVHLEPKTLAVLACLLNEPGEVVSKEKLLHTVWPDRIVEANAVSRNIALLRRALGDEPRQSQYIETIPKRGYRAVAPVRRIEGHSTSTGRSTRSSRAGATLTDLPFDNPSSDTHASLLAPFGSETPTVGVSSLSHSSSDNLATYAECVAEDIRSELANTDVRLIANVSNEDINPNGTDYLIVGRVLGSTNGCRVSLRLVRTSDQRVLWSYQLNEPQSSVHEARFTKAPFVARMVEAILDDIRWVGRLETENEHARESFLAGMVALSEITLGAGGTWHAAVNQFTYAADLDPEFSWPFTLLAIIYANRLGYTITAEQALPLAHENIRRSLELNPNNTYALGQINIDLDLDYESALENLDLARRSGWPLGLTDAQKCKVFFCQGRIEDAIRTCQSAVTVGAGLDQANSLTFLGELFIAAGRHREACELLDRSLDTTGRDVAEDSSHFDPLRARIKAAWFAGDVDQARLMLTRALEFHSERVPNSMPGVLALLGEAELARKTLSQIERLMEEGRVVMFTPIVEGYFFLGDLDSAFIWLEHAVDNREWFIVGAIRCACYFSELREDDRFAGVMERLRHIEEQGSPTPSVATAERLAPA
jgi:DNA-binding winged helix-turn-helix (wHTH) protein